ncbi:hypothetical protein GE09DRAFT_1243833 [Coniochaeta sp. 2T2.1]|nr:hypothetical protein GE09DRAFT_1243833 [Coniochaeta sp. 2T2.1]
MGRPPAYIFVVRHGHRLDASDKQWHLSSPAPYDPPLTYNGWLQTHALGSKISSILRERTREDEAAAAREPNGAKRKRRKYKIIVHSSPFLRCVQTSIGLSAGIAKDPTPLQTPTPNGGMPPIQTLSLNSHALERLDGDPTTPQKRGPARVELHETRKSVLRLDAFLGEWLTPGYFELITPPPESVMMLATAKADLLRPENYQTSFPAYASHVHSSSQGQLWGGSPRSSPTTSQPDGADSFPAGTLSRSSSLSSHHGSPAAVHSPAHTGGYVAPVPHYAVNNNQTIPLGYVSHARDACVNVDYQWDSMRGPLEWGDGGKFGEEWTEMHRRFRNGLQHLVNWYTTAEHPTEMVTRIARWTKKNSSDPDCAVESDAEDDDEETEAIVILVSHGAGCNALIGALTHQPVLMDVSMASLTMAVRKPDEELRQMEHVSTENGKPKGKIPIHEYYDLKILASTEHLRSNSQSSGLNRTPSARGRYPFASALASYNDANGSRATSASAALSNSRRPSGASPPAQAEQRSIWANPRSGITVGSGITSFSTRNTSSALSRTPSIGLWSPVPKDEEEEDDDGMVLNFSHEKRHPVEPPQTPAVTLTTPTPGEQQQMAEPKMPDNVDGVKENGRVSGGLAKSQSEAFLNRKGDETPKASAQPLWAGPVRPPAEAEVVRDLSSTKRRWTVNEMES